MPQVYAPTNYTGEFVTVQPIDAEWKLVWWQFGKARGHGFLKTVQEAAKWCAQLGLSLAGPGAVALFEADVMEASL